MITSVDKNHHEVAVDFEEFIELLVNHGRNIDEDIAKSFNVFDIDGDGLITEDELQTTMSSLGDPMNEKEVKAMIAEADLDGDPMWCSSSLHLHKTFAFSMGLLACSLAPFAF